LNFFEETKGVSQLSKEYGASDAMVYRWRDKALKAISKSFSENTSEKDSFVERDRLMKIIGKQTCVIETLKKISEKL